MIEQIVHTDNFQQQKAIWDIFDKLGKAPAEPKTSCKQPLSNAPSKWFDQITKTFCPVAMDQKNGYGPTAYDIYGHKIPILKKRTPPESQSSYKDYKFFLQWAPKKGKEECLLPKDKLCTEAFDRLVKSNCKWPRGNPTQCFVLNE